MKPSVFRHAAERRSICGVKARLGAVVGRGSSVISATALDSMSWPRGKAGSMAHGSIASMSTDCGYREGVMH